MSSQDRPARRRPRVVRALLLLLVAALLADKVHSVVRPAPTVGHWRSAAARQAYETDYAAALAGLPAVPREVEVPTSYGVVHVLRWSGAEAGPPVVLLPGRSSGAPMWVENLPSWIGRRTVYALDPLGDAGGSAQSVPLTRFEDQAEWVAQALAGLGVPRAHLVGHSFGGATAAAVALRHPEVVASLTLLEPVMVVEGLPVSTYVWATVAALPFLPGTWRERALAHIGGDDSEPVSASPLSRMIATASSGYVAALPQPRRLDDDEWRSLRMPVRLDLGGRESLAGGEAAARRLPDLLPGARVTVWTAATHSLPMQERAALGPSLADFWRNADGA